MGRISHHLTGKDYKNTRQRQLDEKKLLHLELREKQIQLQKDKEFLDYFKSNWKKELALGEGMTTADLTTATLPATGDTVISQVDGYQTIFAGNGGSLSGTDLSYSVRDTDSVTFISGATNTYSRSATTNAIDTTRITQVKFSVSKTAQPLGVNSWTDAGNSQSYNDNISISIYSPSLPLDDATILTSNATTGDYTFDIPKVLRGRTDVVITFTQNALASLVGEPSSGTAAATFYTPTFQRTVPVNVMVSLDDPEASAFIRTAPFMSNLSPEQRQKKLKEMIESSDEYLAKMFGDKFPGTGAVPPGELGDTPGVEIASGGSARGPYGTPGADKPYTRRGYKDKDGKFVDFDNPLTWPTIKVPQAQAPSDTQIAQAPSGRDAKRSQTTPISPVWSPGDSIIPGDVFPRPYWGPTPAGPRLKLAKKLKQPMVAHHELQGEVLVEKRLKSPKEILDKIPGYYDGKPAPLGFPVEPPPEMKNGRHPDLVDGKNVANRFNRLDPISAKAMPLTGNPHIDKKVKSARKKPK